MSLNSIYLKLVALFCCTSLNSIYSKIESPTKYIYVVNAWNKAHNNWHFEALNNLYTKEVWYYCEKLPKAACIRLKTKIVSPSKVFTQKIVSEIKVSEFASGYFKCSFTKEVNYQNKINQYPSYLILSQKGNVIKIVAESDEITDRKLKFQITPEILTSGKLINSEKNKQNQKSETSWFWPTLGFLLLISVLIGLFKWGFRKSEPISPTPKKSVQESAPVTEKENIPNSKPIIEKAYTYYYFRQYIMSKFGPNFLLKEKGPKYRNNYYPKDRFDPELLVEFSYNDYFVEFYVHPVLMKSCQKQTIEILPPREFAVFKELMKAPPRIYIVLAIGEKQDNPDEIFIIPFKDLESNNLEYSSLKKYSYHPKANFYFDMSAYKLIMK
ncbi:MAG: hypothetical protein JNK73_03350 [Bacteroidia bacterium]|nr:hypothetical protein [Bacteroidia bacterium]